jgi:hypothetical protein
MTFEEQLDNALRDGVFPGAVMFAMNKSGESQKR